MKLNLEIIRAYLPDNLTIKSYNLESRKLIFRRPILYEPGMEMISGNLYIMESRDLPKIAPVAGIGIICVGERIPPAWLTGGVQLLCIKENSSCINVFNQVCKIFNKFDDWDEQLRNELEKESDFDIGQLMVLGSEMLENPFSVAGQTLQTVLFIDYQNGASDKPQFFVDKKPRDLTPTHAERIKQVCGLERSLMVPYISAIDIPGIQFYCCNLYPMGYFVGCASLGSYLRPFREIDFPLADHFFDYFKKAFFKYLRDNNQTQSSGAAILQKLLRHETVTDEEKGLFHLEPGESWMFFKLRERRGLRHLPRDYMYGTLNALMPQNIYVAMFHKEIVGMIRLKENDAETLISFGELLARMDYYAGLSSRFCEVDQIDDYLLQANYVVGYDTHAEDSEPLRYFEDHTLDYLLHACTSEMNAASLIHRPILMLADHDRNRGTEYVKTLDVYLRNEMSITKTAETLFIHRSSLMKRLDKIQRIIKEDLEDPDVRLLYRICLMLMKQ